MSDAYIYFLGAREKQLKDWRRTKKPNLIRTINPEFKDLAQTWGWKMIKCTRDHQAPSQQILLSGFGSRKAPRSMGKMNAPRSFDSAPQALCHAINL